METARRWRGPLVAFVVLALLAHGAVLAQYQKAPPDFGGSYVFPTVAHPEPRAAMAHAFDVLALVAMLGLAAWISLWRRSRDELLLLSALSLAYFGFYRHGCVCPIGAIQNVTLSLVDAHYRMSLGVIAFFFLPLAAALLFGRVYCGGACPLGALQDLVLLRPVKVPARLDRALGVLPYVYLALAVLAAGWGLYVPLGDWTLQTGRRFLICEWDPFVPLFRMTGPLRILAVSTAFVGVAMFVGRPYCRWLCPYGGLLSILSRVSWKRVRITPDHELDCGLCADACPFGAIEGMRAQPSACVSCARCYEHCPREREVRAGRGGSPPLIQLERR